MPTSQTCKTCAHFDPFDDHYGLCRRHAPLAVLKPDGDNSDTRATWPTVADTEWCGEYKSIRSKQLRGVL